MPRWRFTLLMVLSLVALGAFLLSGRLLVAQEEAAQKSVRQELSRQTPPGQRGYRRLAPGVMKHIPFEVEPGETVSSHDIVELLAVPGLEWDPKSAPKSRTLHEMAQDVKFRRSVWGLDFTFKPMRMMEIDIPQPNGKLRRELVWYMIYKVTNRGRQLVPVKQEDGLYTVEQVPKEEIRFAPQFFLLNREKSADGTFEEYPDLVVPPAVAAIQEREDPNRKLYNSVEIANIPVPLSTDRVERSIWGVATWLGGDPGGPADPKKSVNPEIDFFSVYVKGLTNAYIWADRKGEAGYQHGDPLGKGRVFRYKELMINFWRPGDAKEPTEEEIIYGVPFGKHQMYGVEPGVDYAWVYR